jgi:glycosyltransferase involved in cell wall biosynthesis
MKISFAVCTHNEGHYVRDLLTSLIEFVKHPINQASGHEFEIVVIDDFSSEDLTERIIESIENNTNHFIKLYHHALAGDFATHKNYMNSKCTGDWIVNLDADERLPDDFLMNLAPILESNPHVEAFWLPRVNTVEGLTLQHVTRWHWVITTLPGFRQARVIPPDSGEYQLLKAYNLILSEDNGFVTFDQPIINWPDPQMRIYRRSPDIQWEGRVHERLIGFENYSMMPTEVEYAIIHAKEIKRQEEQNSLYEMIQR